MHDPKPDGLSEDWDWELALRHCKLIWLEAANTLTVPRQKLGPMGQSLSSTCGQVWVRVWEVRSMGNLSLVRTPVSEQFRRSLGRVRGGEAVGGKWFIQPWVVLSVGA